MSDVTADQVKATREIWLLGSASDKARTKLQENGWKLQLRTAEQIGTTNTGTLE